MVKEGKKPWDFRRDYEDQFPKDKVFEKVSSLRSNIQSMDQFEQDVSKEKQLSMRKDNVSRNLSTTFQELY